MQGGCGCGGAQPPWPTQLRKKLTFCLHPNPRLGEDFIEEGCQKRKRHAQHEQHEYDKSDVEQKEYWLKKKKLRREQQYGHISAVLKKITHDDSDASAEHDMPVLSTKLHEQVQEQIALAQSHSSCIRFDHCLFDGTKEENYDELMKLVSDRVTSLACASQCDTYYVGLCWSPARRWMGKEYFKDDVDYMGHRFKYDEMLVLGWSWTKFVGQGETYLIDIHIDDPRCDNKKRGGGGRGDDFTTYSMLYLCRTNPLHLLQ